MFYYPYTLKSITQVEVLVRGFFTLVISDPDMHRKHGSSVVSALASGARGPGFDPRLQPESEHLQG